MGKKADTVAMQKRLRAAGYEFIRQNGSHMIYKHRENGHMVVVNLNLHRVVKMRLEKEIENDTN